MKNTNEIIWFCAFYEGEGYICNDISNNNRIRVGMDQKDPTPLYIGQKIWGGKIKKRERKSPASDKICTCYTWILYHKDALEFINDIKPFMKIPYKINQMNNAIDKSKIKINRRFTCNYCDNNYANPSGRRRHEKQQHINSDASENQ